MEKQISDRSLVDLLFKTIKEFYLKSENIVSDCKKYDRCRLISTLLSLDEKHEYIKIFCDDEKGRILSVQKPMQPSSLSRTYPINFSVVNEGLDGLSGRNKDTKC